MGRLESAVKRNKASNWKKATEIVLERVSQGLPTFVYIKSIVTLSTVREYITAHVTVRVCDKRVTEYSYDVKRLYEFTYINRFGEISKYYMGQDFVQYLKRKLNDVAEVVEEEIEVPEPEDFLSSFEEAYGISSERIDLTASYIVQLEIRPRRRSE